MHFQLPVIKIAPTRRLIQIRQPVKALQDPKTTIRLVPPGLNINVLVMVPLARLVRVVRVARVARLLRVVVRVSLPPARALFQMEMETEELGLAKGSPSPSPRP